MKKAFDCILLFCLVLLIMSIVMFVIAENPTRRWVSDNKEFAENIAYREPEDPTRGDSRYSALILSFHQNEKPDTFGPKRAKFHYDFEGKGLAVVTGWAKPEAGLLVIDQGWGPKLLGYDGSNPCGFDFLAASDTNGDGLIDANDPIWADLRVWMDKNSDGLMGENEMFSLPELNITSLDLKRKSEYHYLVDGNFILEAGAFHFTGPKGRGDKVGRLDEIFLRQYSDKVKFLNPVEVPAEIAAVVPDIPGSGLMRDLREAATLNPELMPLVVQLMNADDDEQRWARLDELMTAWAKTGGMKETVEERIGNRYKLLTDGFQGPDGTELARRLNVLDAWLGRHIFLLPHELNPVQQIGDMVVIHNRATGEISMNYQPVKEALDKIYYNATHDFFRAFFPDSDSFRPGTEDLIKAKKAVDPKAAR